MIDHGYGRIGGRFIEIAEAANMIAWLTSEENSFTTSAVFELSRGRGTY